MIKDINQRHDPNQPHWHTAYFAKLNSQLAQQPHHQFNGHPQALNISVRLDNIKSKLYCKKKSGLIS